MRITKLTSGRTLHSAHTPIIVVVAAHSKQEAALDKNRDWMKVNKDERELIELYRQRT